MNKFTKALDYIGDGRIDVFKMHSDVRGSHVTPNKRIQKTIIEALKLASDHTNNPYNPISEPFKPLDDIGNKK